MIYDSSNSSITFTLHVSALPVIVILNTPEYYSIVFIEAQAQLYKPTIYLIEL